MRLSREHPKVRGDMAEAGTVEQTSWFTIERYSQDVPLYDYTMRPYRALRPMAGHMRSVNLVYALFSGSSQRDRYVELIQRIRAVLGVDRTVWGVKLDGGRLRLELYFYYRSLSSAKAPEMPEAIVEPIRYGDVVRALGPALRLNVDYPRHLPAIMISVDVGEQELENGCAAAVHAYLMSGFSFDVTPDGVQHKNAYSFFETSERDRLVAMVGHLCNGMAHGSAAAESLERVLLPALYACRTVCLAAKQTTDAVYFAGIKSSQLVWMMSTYGWPADALHFVRTHEDEFAPLFWDVGVDFSCVGGEIRIGKTGIYGTF